MIEQLQQGPDAVLTPGHAALGQVKCANCGQPFVAGDAVTLLPVSPLNEEEAAKHARGEEFIAQCRPVHWLCYLRRLMHLSVWRPARLNGVLQRWRDRAQA